MSQDKKLKSYSMCHQCKHLLPLINLASCKYNTENIERIAPGQAYFKRTAFFSEEYSNLSLPKRTHSISKQEQMNYYCVYVADGRNEYCFRKYCF